MVTVVPTTMGAARAGVAAGEGLAGGLVPVPAWMVLGLGGFIVLMVATYLIVRLVLHRRGLL